VLLVVKTSAAPRTHFGIALAADGTALFGVSANGELALAMGLRHPEI
jgi:hypothetical protein